MTDKLVDWHDDGDRPPQPGEYECAIPFREKVHITRGRWTGEAWEFTDGSFARYGSPIGPVRWRDLTEKP